MKERLDNFIIENRDNILDDIAKLVNIESFCGDREHTAKALDHVLDRAREMGMKTMKSSKNDVGVVEIGQGDQIVGILTHVDVVGIGDITQWKYPPFEGHIADGYIWGRGTLDDKGPVIMMLYTLKALKDLGLTLNKRIWLIIGTAEEGVWTDMDTFKEEFEQPAFGFSPDGSFPIINREKGYCDIGLFFKEPDVNMIEELQGGDSPNSVPARASIKLKGRKENIYSGVASHSSVPGNGVNAIEKLAADQDMDFRFVRFIMDFLAGDPNGTKLGIDDPKYADNDVLDKTTVVPTIIRLKDGGVELTINMRLWFGVTREKVESAFEKYADEYGYKADILDFHAPLEVPEDRDFLQAMARVYESFGLKNRFSTTLGTTYAKSMDNCVSWGPRFEDEPRVAHTENERMNIESILLAARIYLRYLAAVAAGLEID